MSKTAKQVCSCGAPINHTIAGTPVCDMDLARYRTMYGEPRTLAEMAS